MQNSLGCWQSSVPLNDLQLRPCCVPWTRQSAAEREPYSRVTFVYLERSVIKLTTFRVQSYSFGTVLSLPRLSTVLSSVQSSESSRTFKRFWTLAIKCERVRPEGRGAC